MDNFRAYGDATANGVARGASLGGFLYYTAWTMKVAVGGPIGWAAITSAAVGAVAFGAFWESQGGAQGGAQGAYNYHTGE